MASNNDSNGLITLKSGSSGGGPGGNAFPKWMYHPTLAPVMVQNQGQENALISADSNWSESPVNAATSAPVVSFVPKFTTMNTSQSFANDAAAAAAGVPVGQIYRNGSVLQVRVS